MDFEAFKLRFEHKPVQEYPNQVGVKPLVSVCVMTYNHVNYIKHCLDGILMQETDFPFEILIGEDDSKDGTREICIEYACKYPDNIRLFLHHRDNNIAVNGTPTGWFNSMYCLYNSTGKYIALCEGDDYWVDHQKLQKQVDFMEQNADCSLSFHPAKVTYEDNSFPDKIFKPSESEIAQKFTLIDFISSDDGLGITTASVLFRINLFKQIPDWLFQAPYGDASLKLIAAYKGNLGYIEGAPMSLHRRVTPGSWSSKIHTPEWYTRRIEDRLLQFDLFREYTGHLFDKEINRANKKKIANILFRMAVYCRKKDLLKLLVKYSDSIPYLKKSEIAALCSRLFLSQNHYKKLMSLAKRGA